MCLIFSKHKRTSLLKLVPLLIWSHSLLFRIGSEYHLTIIFSNSVYPLKKTSVHKSQKQTSGILKAIPEEIFLLWLGQCHSSSKQHISSQGDCLGDISQSCQWNGWHGDRVGKGVSATIWSTLNGYQSTFWLWWSIYSLTWWRNSYLQTLTK